MSDPEGAVASRSTTIEPMLSVRRGAAAVAFYAAAFDAHTLMRIDAADGAVVARLAIGAATFWVADESPEHGNFSPATLGGATTRLILTVADPHAVFTHALAAGATLVAPVEEQPYGWLVGRVADQFGHHWEIGKPLVVDTLPSPHAARPRGAAETLMRAYVITTGTASA